MPKKQDKIFHCLERIQSGTLGNELKICDLKLYKKIGKELEKVQTNEGATSSWLSVNQFEHRSFLLLLFFKEPWRLQNVWTSQMSLQIVITSKMSVWRKPGTWRKPSICSAWLQRLQVPDMLHLQCPKKQSVQIFATSSISAPWMYGRALSKASNKSHNYCRRQQFRQNKLEIYGILKLCWSQKIRFVFRSQAQKKTTLYNSS